MAIVKVQQRADKEEEEEALMPVITANSDG
jgi:hypothetical protein